MVDGSVLAPPSEGEGLQLKMVSMLEAGRETEKCQMFVVEEDIAFNRSEVAFTEGSHHVLLFETEYTEIPTEDENGNPVDAAAVHECPEGAPDIWSVVRVVGGSQNPDGNNFLDGLPDGVAMKVKPGTVLLMNTHYINTQPEPIETEAAINLYTIPQSDVKTEAGVLFYYNPFIQVAAESTGRARMRCPISEDIEVLNVQSHMHKMGMNYAANLTDAAGVMVDEFYTNTKWENVPIGRFEPTLKIAAGESIDYWCDYDNKTSDDVFQGLTTKDEMCMLIGPYWPRNDKLELCEDDARDFAATWVGNGDRTCGESYACLLDAIDAQGDLVKNVAPCMVNACERAAEPLSKLLNCFASSNDCSQQCGDGGEGCTGCLIESCAPQAESCGAAQCGE